MRKDLRHSSRRVPLQEVSLSDPRVLKARRVNFFIWQGKRASCLPSQESSMTQNVVSPPVNQKKGEAPKTRQVGV